MLTPRTIPESTRVLLSQSLVKEVQEKVKILYAKHKRASARRRWRCVRAAVVMARCFKTKAKHKLTDDALGEACSGLKVVVEVMLQVIVSPHPTFAGADARADANDEKGDAPTTTDLSGRLPKKMAGLDRFVRELCSNSARSAKQCSTQDVRER